MRIDYLWANEPPGLYRIDGRQRGEESEEVSEEVTGLKDTIVFFLVKIQDIFHGEHIKMVMTR